MNRAAPPGALPPDRPVAVLGAGTMGAGIAWVAAEHGHPTLLYDLAPSAVDAALADMRSRLERSVDKGSRSVGDVTAMLSRIDPVTAIDQLAGAGLVIEAIVERLDMKRDVLAEVAKVVATDTVIATNTSSLSVTAIAAGLSLPERFVGMHFFNPAAVMPLVEIVHGDATSSETAALAAATAEAWGKTAIHSASTPGFVVNRVARPFYGEALRLLAEGSTNAVTLDAIVTGAGDFPMGPFALMDLIGLDVNLAVSTSVYEQTFHDPRFAPSVIQQGLVDAGRLGRKSGRGFHDYTDAETGADGWVRSAGVAFEDGLPAIEVVGRLGHAAGLVDRLGKAGAQIRQIEGRRGEPGHLRIGLAALVPTDGRTATELAAGEVLETAEVAVLDLVRDWATASRVAMANAVQARGDPAAPFAGVLREVGVAVSVVADTPGLVLMRIVAQLASVAADAVMLGVANREAVDTAMRLGTNYPLGPLEWADAVGPTTIVTVIDNIRAFYGEDRYRTAGLLRRSALAGASLGEGDEA